LDKLLLAIFSARTKKIISLVISFFIFYSFSLYGVLDAVSLPEQKTFKINTQSCVVSDMFFNSKNNGSMLVFIQDLHTNASVQKNIAKIIDTIDKDYQVDNILIEGAPYEKINTKVINYLKKYGSSQDWLLNNGMFSGAEYYLSKYKKNIPVYGIEDWNIYLSNIKRAAEILKERQTTIEQYDEFRSSLYSKIKNSENIIKYAKFNLSDEKLLAKFNCFEIWQYA